MDTTDRVLIIAMTLFALVLGGLMGYSSAKKSVYAACERDAPLVIEVNGVDQVYSCRRAD